MIQSAAGPLHRIHVTHLRAATLGILFFGLAVSACGPEQPKRETAIPAVVSPSATIAPSSTVPPTATASPSETATSTQTATAAPSATPTVGASATQPPTTTPTLTVGPSEARQTEEYAVYSAVINPNLSGYLTGGLILIQSETSPPFFDITPVFELFAKDTQASRSLLDDFNATNKVPGQLTSRFSLKYKYEMLDDKTRAEIFSGPPQGEWDRFYERYPGSSGMVMLSRVGFNPEMNQAFVVMGIQRGPLFGIGHAYLLEKRNGTWQVLKMEMVWIS